MRWLRRKEDARKDLHRLTEKLNDRQEAWQLVEFVRSRILEINPNGGDISVYCDPLYPPWSLNGRASSIGCGQAFTVHNVSERNFAQSAEKLSRVYAHHCITHHPIEPNQITFHLNT